MGAEASTAGRVTATLGLPLPPQLTDGKELSRGRQQPGEQGSTEVFQNHSGSALPLASPSEVKCCPVRPAARRRGQVTLHADNAGAVTWDLVARQPASLGASSQSAGFPVDGTDGRRAAGLCEPQGLPGVPSLSRLRVPRPAEPAVSPGAVGRGYATRPSTRATFPAS